MVAATPIILEALLCLPSLTYGGLCNEDYDEDNCDGPNQAVGHYYSKLPS